MTPFNYDGIDLIFATPQRRNRLFSTEEQRVLGWFDRSAYLDLGHMCNQSCRYCWQTSDERRHALYDVVIQQLDLARRVGIEQIILIGGEPLLYPRLDDLVAAMRVSGIQRWGVMSNGILLADANRLKRLVKRGLAYCQISFDSPYPDVQNGLAQNPKLFDALMCAFGNLSHYPQLALDFNAVITRENAGHLSHLVDFVDALRNRYKMKPVLAMTQMKPLEDARNTELRLSDLEARDALIPTIEEAATRDLPLFVRNLPSDLLGPYSSRLADCLLGIVRLWPDGHIDPPQESGCGQIPESWWRDRVKLVEEKSPESPFFSLAAMSGDLVNPIANEMEKLLARLTADDRRPILITGAEAVRYPQLPTLVERLHQTGREVWLESSGLAFTAHSRLKLLKGKGLKGLRLLHFPLDHPSYRTLTGGPLDPTTRRNILNNCRDSGLILIHTVPVQMKRADEFGVFLMEILALIRETDQVEIIAPDSDERMAFYSLPINRSDLEDLRNHLKSRRFKRVEIHF
jgi:sulfatase maturation enzyme AslB (radical SAM superfamily)